MVCSALQIFKKEDHPSVYKTGQSSTKEGLSLYGTSKLRTFPKGLCCTFSPSLCFYHPRYSEQNQVSIRTATVQVSFTSFGILAACL